MPNWRGEDSCVVLLFLYMSSCSWKPLNHFFMPNGTRVKNNTISLCFVYKNSVADPGCFSRIPDSNFTISDSGSKRYRIPDPEPRKKFKYF
jgi:hypothetical protein